jgi:2,3-dimethylmalate lyase
MTGAGTAAERGFLDVGLLPMSDMVPNARDSADAVQIPVICDADTRSGHPRNGQRPMRAYERAGVAAIHLEDQVFPKTYGFFTGKQLIPLEEHVQKSRAALDARSDPDLVIIARCDASAVTGWEDTGQRCRACREAGAALVFVDGLNTREDLQRSATDSADLPRRYTGDLAPTQEVAALGYRLMICGSTMGWISKQLREAFEELPHTGLVHPERYGTRGDVAPLDRLSVSSASEEPRHA